jgi:hypothetical protein
VIVPKSAVNECASISIGLLSLTTLSPEASGGGGGNGCSPRLHPGPPRSAAGRTR